MGGLGDFFTNPNAEIYDPASGTWSLTGSTTRRSRHTATLLPNGKVLVVGGIDNHGVTQASAALYDPATGLWKATGVLASARQSHTATLLADGNVLVAAGSASNNASLAGAEVYDPSTGAWTATGSLTIPRTGHTATLLPNGTVLVALGGGGDTSAEIYDPATGSWSAAGALAGTRYGHTATLLPGGKVLVAGGFIGNRFSIKTAEVYTPAPVALLGAASRLTHGSAGAFEIEMPLSGDVGIENRRALTYQAVFTFDGPVTSGSVTVSSGTATIGTATFSGHEMSVPLTEVTNAQTLTLQVANVNGSGLIAGEISFGFLTGDTTADGLVNYRDVSQAKSQSGHPVGEDNFRVDVTADGLLDRGDARLVKSKYGSALP